MKTNYERFYQNLPDSFDETVLSEVKSKTEPKFKPKEPGTWTVDAVNLWLAVGMLEETPDGYKKAAPDFPGQQLYNRLPADSFNMDWMKIYAPKHWNFNKEQFFELCQIWHVLGRVQETQVDTHGWPSYQKKTPRKRSAYYNRQ